MARKTYGLEQIIALLREADVALGQGRTVGEVCRELGVTAVTYYVYGRLSHCKSISI